MDGRRRRGQDDDAIPLREFDEEEDDHFLASAYVDDGEDQEGEARGHTRLVPLARTTAISKISTVPKRPPYQFKRYPARAFANVIGPLFVLAYFLFVIYEYLERPPNNGVTPMQPISARPVFFFWVILSIFILDWAKSAIAGFEAAALMRPQLAPSSAIRLMWHLDRNWGSVSGWYEALTYTFKYWFGKEGRRANAHWDGPGILWWYLALSSILFYIAVPLLGLTVNPGSAVKLSNREITIIGPNETTFDLRTNSDVADLARNTWRQGLPTKPYGSTVFYAAQGTEGVSDTFFEDKIQMIYQADLAQKPVTNRNVTFFSGPVVAERAHGRAWGLLTGVACSAANIYNGLELIKVKSFGNWSAPGISSSTFDAAPLLKAESSYLFMGANPSMFFNDTLFGVSFEYLVALDDKVLDLIGVPAPEYNNASALPIEGSFEIAMWQKLVEGFGQDDELTRMSKDPLVESSNGSLGYGVRCTVSSSVGFAQLDAAKRTFNDFGQTPSQLSPEALGAAQNAFLPTYQFPGLLSVQWTVFAALTKLIPGFIGPAGCLPSEVNPALDPTCNLFYSANLATGGVPYLANVTTPAVDGPVLRQAIIGPERMTLATYKIFGETAAAMMAQGPSNWTTSNLQGMDQASSLEPGPIPWQLVLGLLIIWAFITVLPQFWTFWGKRWSATLDPFELFRFGAEWRDAVQQFESNEAWENKILRRLPGMIGDMEKNSQRGFVGLSYDRADLEREYVNNRAEA